MNQPASLNNVETAPKGILELIRERKPGDLLRDILAVLRARWYLRDADHIGQRVRLWGRMRVENRGRLTIGDRVRLNATITPSELVTGPNGKIEIGNSVFLNYGCSVASLEYVRIADYCSIGTYAIIMDNSFHRLEPDLRNEMPESGPVILEENVWLGARVTVLPGVTIGRDSVIGAGSVVTRSIPPRSLAAGVPARIIRTL